MSSTSAYIPLFPLNSILFPKGRLSLQIFESRYMDLVRNCLRDQEGFGVVLIDRGSEVARPGQVLDIKRVGTYGRIVDWNQLENGLLGITVEGVKSFRILDFWQEGNQLCRGEVAFREEDSIEAGTIDISLEYSGYVELLKGLSQHPAIQELKLDIDFTDLREVAWRLSDLLPIATDSKQELLEMDNAYSRLDMIEEILNAINE